MKTAILNIVNGNSENPERPHKSARAPSIRNVGPPRSAAVASVPPLPVRALLPRKLRKPLQQQK
jgi:hypothetical protein